MMDVWKFVCDWRCRQYFRRDCISVLVGRILCYKGKFSFISDPQKYTLRQREIFPLCILCHVRLITVPE